MARRYKVGENAIYDKVYDKIRVNSWIINGGVRNQNLVTAGRMESEQAVMATKLELIGNKEGKYFYSDANEYRQAQIPYWNEVIEDVDKAFEKHCQKQINRGHSKPTEMPQELLERQMTAFAQIDILEDSLALCNRLLKEYSEVKVEQNNDNILKYGLQQSGKIRGGTLSELDGQRIVVNENGILIIDQGIYEGLSVADYREMANKWIAQKNQAELEAKKARAEEIQKTGKSNIIVPSYGQTVRRSSLPKFPENCINHKKKDAVKK